MAAPKDITATYRMCGQFDKVVNGLGNGITEQTNDDAANLLVADGHVKENLRGKQQHQQQQQHVYT